MEDSTAAENSILDKIVPDDIRIVSPTKDIQSDSDVPDNKTDCESPSNDSENGHYNEPSIYQSDEEIQSDQSQSNPTIAGALFDMSDEDEFESKLTLEQLSMTSNLSSVDDCSSQLKRNENDISRLQDLATIEELKVKNNELQTLLDGREKRSNQLEECVSELRSELNELRLKYGVLLSNSRAQDKMVLKFVKESYNNRVELEQSKMMSEELDQFKIQNAELLIELKQVNKMVMEIEELNKLNIEREIIKHNKINLEYQKTIEELKNEIQILKSNNNELFKDFQQINVLMSEVEHLNHLMSSRTIVTKSKTESILTDISISSESKPSKRRNNAIYKECENLKKKNSDLMIEFEQLSHLKSEVEHLKALVASLPNETTSTTTSLATGLKQDASHVQDAYIQVEESSFQLIKEDLESKSSSSESNLESGDVSDTELWKANYEEAMRFTNQLLEDSAQKKKISSELLVVSEKLLQRNADLMAEIDIMNQRMLKLKDMNDHRAIQCNQLLIEKENLQKQMMENELQLKSLSDLNTRNNILISSLGESKNRMDELSLKEKQLNDSIASLTLINQNYICEVEQLRRNMKEYETIKVNMEARVVSLEEDNLMLSEELNKRKSEIHQLNNTILNLDTKNCTLLVEVETLQKSLEVTSAAKHETHRQLILSEQQNHNLVNEMEVLRSTTSGSDVTVNELKSKVLMLEQLNGAMAAELKSSVLDYETMRHDYTSKITSLEKLNKTVTRESDKLKAMIADYEVSKQYLSARLSALDQLNSKMVLDLSSMESEKEIEKKNFESEISQLHESHNKLYSDMTITISEYEISKNQQLSKISSLEILNNNLLSEMNELRNVSYEYEEILQQLTQVVEFSETWQVEEEKDSLSKSKSYHKMVLNSIQQILSLKKELEMNQVKNIELKAECDVLRNQNDNLIQDSDLLQQLTVEAEHLLALNNQSETEVHELSKLVATLGASAEILRQRNIELNTEAEDMKKKNNRLLTEVKLLRHQNAIRMAMKVGSIHVVHNNNKSMETMDDDKENVNPRRNSTIYHV